MDARRPHPVLLCVDDQEIALAVRKRVLERVGFRVLTATSAHEALEIFGENHVDLVLAERVVPTIIGGPTLAATMKMLKPEVPIAIYSADWEASPEDMRFADVFITKLVTVDELLGAIKILLRKDRFATPRLLAVRRTLVHGIEPPRSSHFKST